MYDKILCVFVKNTIRYVILPKTIFSQDMCNVYRKSLHQPSVENSFTTLTHDGEKEKNQTHPLKVFFTFAVAQEEGQILRC